MKPNKNYKYDLKCFQNKFIQMHINRKGEINQRPQIYHNYNLSTKKFDGNLLYNLFLANKKTSSPGMVKNSQQKDRKPRNLKFSTEMRKELQSQEYYSTLNPKNKQSSFHSNQIFADSSEFEKHELKTPSPNCLFVKRNCVSGNNFYSNLYESMKAKLKKYENQKEVVQKRNENVKKKSRPVILKMSQKNIKAEDFIEPEIFNEDILKQGRINGLSAESITIINGNKRLYEVQGDVCKEIASLTKIMTCIVCLFLAKKHEIDITTKQVKVSRRASMIPGTTANLKIGDVLTVEDLIYGMMLPSGNDAAYALAEFFGKVAEQNRKQEDVKRFKKKINESQDLQKTVVSNYDYFIKEMNNFAIHLKMKRTSFNNPHGLSDKKNKSTSNDVGELCYYAMKNQKFRKIVKTKEYQLKIFNSQQKMKRDQKWINTNKLLRLENCEGIKTGITPAAGPCMTAYFTSEGFSAIIVILNSKSKSSRFYEVKQLYQWAKSLVSL